MDSDRSAVVRLGLRVKGYRRRFRLPHPPVEGRDYADFTMTSLVRSCRELY